VEQTVAGTGPDVPCARSGDKQVDRAFAFKEAPNPKVREWLPKDMLVSSWQLC